MGDPAVTEIFQKLWPKPIDLNNIRRFFIREGDVVLFHSTKRRKVVRHLFLFNDRLLITKKKSDKDKYSHWVKNDIFLHKKDIDIENMRTASHNHEFRLHLPNRITFILFARTDEEKDAWCDDLTKAVRGLHEDDKTRKRREEREKEEKKKEEQKEKEQKEEKQDDSSDTEEEDKKNQNSTLTGSPNKLPTTNVRTRINKASRTQSEGRTMTRTKKGDVPNDPFAQKTPQSRKKEKRTQATGDLSTSQQKINHRSSVGPSNFPLQQPLNASSPTQFTMNPQTGSPYLSRGGSQDILQTSQGSHDPFRGGSLQNSQGSQSPFQGSQSPFQSSLLASQGSQSPFHGSLQTSQGSQSPFQGSLQSSQGPFQGSLQGSQGYQVSNQSINLNTSQNISSLSHDPFAVGYQQQASDVPNPFSPTQQTFSVSQQQFFVQQQQLQQQLQQQQLQQLQQQQLQQQQLQQLQQQHLQQQYQQQLQQQQLQNQMLAQQSPQVFNQQAQYSPQHSFQQPQYPQQQAITELNPFEHKSVLPTRMKEMPRRTHSISYQPHTAIFGNPSSPFLNPN